MGQTVGSFSPTKGTFHYIILQFILVDSLKSKSSIASPAMLLFF